MQFISPTKGEMDLTQVVKDILDYVSDELNYTYKLIVGTDSQPHEDNTCFVSAIIIHRIGKGARYYYNKQMQQNIISMRQRIFYEASLSLDLADQVCRCLKEHGRDDLKVEIHLDVGIHGATRDLIKEVIGMVVGSGFDAKIKPYSCGASKVADKYTK
jgi:predicted RNase H-related nuclease YkuK (DUF458 family)